MKTKFRFADFQRGVAAHDCLMKTTASCRQKVDELRSPTSASTVCSHCVTQLHVDKVEQSVIHCQHGRPYGARCCPSWPRLLPPCPVVALPFSRHSSRSLSLSLSLSLSSFSPPPPPFSVSLCLCISIDYPTITPRLAASTWRGTLTPTSISDETEFVAGFFFF